MACSASPQDIGVIGARKRESFHTQRQIVHKQGLSHYEIHFKHVLKHIRKRNKLESTCEPQLLGDYKQKEKTMSPGRVAILMTNHDKRGITRPIRNCDKNVDLGKSPIPRETIGIS